MNQQEILKKIGVIISELTDQYNYLEASSNSFNSLELELFMANANFLTDHIEILKKIHGQASSATLPTAPPTLTAEKVYGQRQAIPDYFSEEEQLQYTDDNLPLEIEEATAAETPELLLPETKEPEVTKTESIQLPEVMPQDEVIELPPIADASFTEQKTVPAEKPFEEVIVPEVEVVPEANVKPEINVQTEIYVQPKAEPEPVVFVEERKPEPAKAEPAKTEPALTLNERIAAQRNSDQSKPVATEISTKAVQTPNKAGQDLQSLISLNDKLLFVKELFNGYNLAYSEAINILNRYTSFEQAENFLKINYSVKNNWNNKPSVSERFFDILRKKFS